MTHKIARFFALNWPQRKMLVVAMVALPLFEFGLRLVGLRRFCAWLDAQPVASRALPLGQDAFAVGTLVNIAAAHVPFPATCLSRSLLLRWLLNRRGLANVLRIGVRRVEGGIEAHAWVEREGRAVNDTPDVSERFAPFDGQLSRGSFRAP